MSDQRITGDLMWQTMGLYGPSGAGKSQLAAGAPQPLICDTNNGLLVIADRPGYEHVRREIITKMRTMDLVYSKFAGTHKKIDWSKKFATCVHDHFDDEQNLIMDELGEAALLRDSSRNIDEWQQKEYGVLYTRLSRYLRKFKKLPKHQILITGETRDNDSGRLRPALVGQMKDKLSYFCDHIMYLRIGKKGVRWLHLRETDDFFAKTRAWWLTPEQCRIRVEPNDTTLLTRVIEEIRKGPVAKRSSEKRSTKHVVKSGRTRA